MLRAHGAQVSLFFAAEKGMTDEIAARIAAGQDVNACNQEGRTALDLALAKDHEEAAALLRSHNALEGKQVKERVHKAWRDAGNVVVLDHVACGALYEDYTMLFGNFNTFKVDVKLAAGNSTTSYTSSISKASHNSVGRRKTFRAAQSVPRVLDNTSEATSSAGPLALTMVELSSVPTTSKAAAALSVSSGKKATCWGWRATW